MSTSKIHPKLALKLSNDKEKYKKVTAFAKLLPMYEDVIIGNEYTGECFCKLSNHYDKICFDWGINWYVNTPTNYKKEITDKIGFVSVYINCIVLFGESMYSFAQQELSKTIPNIKVHFYDVYNTTFYFLPSEVEEGLFKLNEWFISVKSKQDEYLKQKKIKKLEEQLLKLKS